MENIIIIETEAGHFTVQQGDRLATDLCYDEMLAVFVSLTLPEQRAGLQWMLNPEQRLAKEKYYEDLKNRSDIQLT